MQIKKSPKQAGAELGQAQIKLELGFTLIILLNKFIACDYLLTPSLILHTE